MSNHSNRLAPIFAALEAEKRLPSVLCPECRQGTLSLTQPLKDHPDKLVGGCEACGCLAGVAILGSTPIVVPVIF